MRHPPVIVVQLVHISGPMKGEIQEFTEPVISIGRHSSCHLRFPANLTQISRKHAEIIRDGNRFKLVDQSTNGTFVNGKRVQEIYLKNGDVLEFSEGGPKVSFLSEIKEAPMETPLPPPPREKEFAPEPPRPLSPQRPSSPPLKESPEGRPQRVKVSLLIQYGPTIRSFKELPVTIGKGQKCEFILDQPWISDEHAQIFFFENEYWIKDLTGQKLVQINHQPISFQAPLKQNDEIGLTPRGPTFRYLGEGRLAEVEEVSPPEEETKKKEEPPKVAEKKESKGLFSFFKK